MALEIGTTLALLGTENVREMRVFSFILGSRTPQVTPKQDGAREPECKHVRKATYVQMTLL